MAKTTEREANFGQSGELLRAEFKRKFGHGYDAQGYHGHPFYGYRCYGCGIHISQVTANKGLRGQLDVGEAKSGKRFSRRMGNAGTEAMKSLAIP